VRLRQRINTLISNEIALDEADASELGQSGQPHDGGISQSGTTSQVNIPNSRAAVSEVFDRFIRNLPAVSQMQIMEVLAKLADGIHSHVGDVATFL
jgi:hypothetical protein